MQLCKSSGPNAPVCAHLSAPDRAEREGCSELSINTHYKSNDNIVIAFNVFLHLSV